MKYWDDFFAMMVDAKKHVDSYGYGLKPYQNNSFLGFSCEATGKIWQVDVVRMSTSLSSLPNLLSAMKSYDGRTALARSMKYGTVTAAWSASILDLNKELSRLKAG